MRAGVMRSRLEIQTEVKTPDGRGGSTITWAAAHRVACSVDDAWARERLAAGGLEGNVGTVITIRQRTGVTVGMRAVVTSGPGLGTYNIRGVQDLKARGAGRVEGLLLNCERGTAV